MADALVSANVRGVDTHGVFHLAMYVKAVQDGKLDATASPSIVRETPNTALVDGNRTFGHVAAKFATDVAVRKAKENDVAVVGLVRSEHIGRLGEYAEMAAAAGVVSIICGAGYSLLGSKVAAPYGGSKGLLSSNPIAMGFPGGDEPRHGLRLRHHGDGELEDEPLQDAERGASGGNGNRQGRVPDDQSHRRTGWADSSCPSEGTRGLP